MRKVWVSVAAIAVLYILWKGPMMLFFYGPLFRVESFVIFYGHPDDEKIKELEKQDAVILEPTAFTKGETVRLQEKGVKVFGYVSLMQLENWNEELKKDVLPSDYARQNGEKLYVSEWDTYVMNISDSHYREVLMKKIRTEVAGKDLDGVFFDTVDDLDHYFREDAELERAMRDGYRTLLDELASTYPDLLIIQNRGFDSYKTVSRKKVDGILWEGFDHRDVQTSEWAQNWRDYLKKEQRFGRVRVLTVVTDQASFDQSKRDRFPAFMRTGGTYQ